MKGKMRILILILIFCSICLTACGKESGEQAEADSMNVQNDNKEEGLNHKAENAYIKICKEAGTEENLDDRETVKQLVKCLGRAGYCAVDAKNRVDMVNREEIEAFFENPLEHAGETRTVYAVMERGNLLEYTFEFEEKTLCIQTVYRQWNGESLLIQGNNSYQDADYYYRKGGYLFFQEERPAGYDGPEDSVALRLGSLPEECREWNERAIRPIGYDPSDFFFTEWSEGNYGTIDFYDLYESFYQMKFGKYPVFQVAGGEQVYQISAELFESVYQFCLPVKKEFLQKSMKYQKDKNCYLYKQRGMNDLGAGPSYAFPEVVKCTNNADGTITLTVQAVWAKKKRECAFCHEVTVKETEDGNFLFLSNHMIKGEGDLEPSWHTNREEIPDVNQTDAEEAKAECLKAMKLIASVYEKARQNENQEEMDALEEQMLQKLAETGEPSASFSGKLNMENPEKMEAFLENVKRKKDAKVNLYELLYDGGVGRSSFLYQNQNMFLLHACCNKRQDGTTVAENVTLKKVQEWKFTEKGWFIYELEVPKPPEVTEVVDGAVMIRVKPVSEECRLLNNQYLLPVGYQGNNLFSTDWDEKHMEGLDYSGLFEAFYRLREKKGMEFGTYSDGVSSETFEETIMSCLPVTRETLRKLPVYKKEKGIYEYQDLSCGNYIPHDFGLSVPEITEVTENKDGTLTLHVDAVCEYLKTDCLISHQVRIRQEKDGKVTFLSNKVLSGKENIPDYQFRVQ